MATDPRAVHWPKREVRQSAYAAVILLTDSASLLAHCAANDLVSQT